MHHNPFWSFHFESNSLYYCDKISWPKAPWGRKGFISDYSFTLWYNIEQSGKKLEHVRNLQIAADAKVKQECCLLACPPWYI